LALNKIDTIKQAFTQVNQTSIFDNCPFKVVNKAGQQHIKINHINVIKNFIRGRKTFGESNNLRQLLSNKITKNDFQTLQNGAKEIIVSVSNLTANAVEYKRLKEYSYDDFLDWIWISCNYVPFMSLVTKNGCEYADGGLGCMIPIEEAVRRGATEVDAIFLDTEFQQTNRMHSNNPFDALGTIFDFISDRIESQNLHIGQLVADDFNSKLNLFYTPKVLTQNSLVFNQEQMNSWWQMGWEYAEKKCNKNK
jgi:predicted patatin/cPLA2 family phospholipase